MSRSSLWCIDKDFFGCEIEEFENSWNFSPIVWNLLMWKYTPYVENWRGERTTFIAAATMDRTVYDNLNEKLNHSVEQCDRIVWELSNQQVFFSKDKRFVANMIRMFIKSECVDHNTFADNEEIAKRFCEIAEAIENIDEREYPYFIFKNTSCDDNVERLFCNADGEKQSLLDNDEYLTEFVIIQNEKITQFISNLDYRR